MCNKLIKKKKMFWMCHVCMLFGRQVTATWHHIA